MKSFLALSVLPLLASATNILLPLYVYPSETFGDNASNWQSLLTTIRGRRSVQFDVIINPDDGPGGPGHGRDDLNYQTGVKLLNAEPNVRTLGYVHTSYGAIGNQTVLNNVTAWAAWPAPYNVKGIFFDETPNGNGRTTNESAYMSLLASRTRSAGPLVGGTLVFNVGQKVVEANEATYFSAADIVIAFEESWAVYQTTNPIANNVPSGKASKCAFIVHHFTDALATLNTELRRISTAGIGWVWFTTTTYNTYTTPNANAQNEANALP